jgi:NAD(P)-dependent dehydrogenase (short-subunit alcohol dehydrogenase family)
MTNPFSLENKRILVTGASSGIGRAIAKSFGEMGAEVICTARDSGRLDSLIIELNQISKLDHKKIVADLTLLDSYAAILEEIKFPLDGVVHCAGISRLAPFRQITQSHLREVYLINTEAPILLTQRLLAKKLINNGGSILFIASIAAHIGVQGVGAYSASKAALIAAMRCLASEVAKHKIRANCLSPAIIDTPILDATRIIKGVEETNKLEKDYPLGFGKTEDVANAAIYFLSDASRWVTGTSLILDGGLTIY